MNCSIGNTNPNTQTKLRLFSDAAGYCQRPECRMRLFSDEGEKDFHIAEMAHIFAANDKGPRANSVLTEDERSVYENLILLCPNCHTIIDKAPETYPDSLIREWKSTHTRMIREVLGIVKYSNRNDVRRYIEPLLQKNKVVFEKFAPHNDYRENPEAEEAATWKRKMLSQIIPNNKQVLLALDANRELASSTEFEIIEAFRQHLDDLIERHVGDDKTEATTFPLGMVDLFLDEGHNVTHEQ